jgi:hypothetical protein
LNCILSKDPFKGDEVNDIGYQKPVPAEPRPEPREREARPPRERQEPRGEVRRGGQGRPQRRFNDQED